MNELKVSYSVALYRYLKKFKYNINDIEYLMSFLYCKSLDNISKCLTPLSITTATMAYDSTLTLDYVKLSNDIKECSGLILAIKSSAIPLEECIKNKYTKANTMIMRREKRNKKYENVSHKNKRVGYGNGLYFQSSVEYVVGTEEKHYNVRVSPKGGSIQIQGLNSPVYENSNFYVQYVLDYISNKLNLDKFVIFNQRFIIVNAKTKFIHNDSHMRLTKIAEIIRDIIYGKINIRTPYPIMFITNTDEVESFIMIKFATPTDTGKITKKSKDRMTSVKIFAKKKINILGAPNIVIILEIYKFLGLLLHTFVDDIMVNMDDKVDYVNTEFKWIEFI